MEIKDLAPFVLLIVLSGMLIGIGALVFDKFGEQTYTLTAADNDSITWVNDTNIQLSNGNISSWSRLVIDNGTVVPTTDYLLYASNGTIDVLYNTTAIDGATVGAYYTFQDFGTNARTVSETMGTNISAISSNWLSLLITVVILAVILGLVLTAFAGRR